MARPQKQTVDYFPHDANASNSDTLSIIEGHFGNDGYAFWFKLLEKLSTSDNHIIDCRNSRKWQLLLTKSHLSEEKGEAIMKLLIELSAIDTELWQSQRIIWCQKFVDGVADAYKNRRRPIPTRPVSTENNSVSTDRKPHTKLNDIRLNKETIQRKNIIEQFNKFWEAYPKRVSKGQAEKAFFKLNPDEKLLAIILDAIERAKESENWQKEGGKFIQNPATWLNAKGWEDEHLKRQQPESDDNKPIPGLKIR